MDWVLVTEDMKFPDVTIDTKIEVLDLSSMCYMKGFEFDVGRRLIRRAGECIWSRTSIHAYRLLE